MEQIKFNSRYSEIQFIVNTKGIDYRFRNESDIWQNIGSNSFDIFFTELASLYLESNAIQKQELYVYCGQQPLILENIWYFIRRISVLIQGNDDKKILEIGIASALLDGGRGDFRDLIVSLVLLRFVAEKQKIDTKSIFDKFIQSSEGRIKDILESVQSHSKSSIVYVVRPLAILIGR